VLGVLAREGVDAADQIIHADEGAALDDPQADQPERALHLVDPGRVRRREVDVEAGVPGQPRPHLGVLVGRVVVDHQMHLLQSRGHLLVDQPQKGQVLLVPVALGAARDHLPRGGLQGGQHGRRAVAAYSD